MIQCLRPRYHPKPWGGVTYCDKCKWCRPRKHKAIRSAIAALAFNPATLPLPSLPL